MIDREAEALCTTPLLFQSLNKNGSHWSIIIIPLYSEPVLPLQSLTSALSHHPFVHLALNGSWPTARSQPTSSAHSAYERNWIVAQW